MHAIRRAYPLARITLVTWPEEMGRAETGKLLEGAEWLDEILIYRKAELAGLRGKLAMLRDLRRRRFDVWFGIPASHWSLGKLLVTMLLARLAHAKWAYGWRLSRVGSFAQAQSEWLDRPTQVERLLAIVRKAGLQCEGLPRWPLPIKDAHRQRVCALLNEIGWRSQPLVAIAPCAGHANRRWPIERFGAAARALAEDGWRVVIVGGPADAATCEAVAYDAGGKTISLAGRLSLLESCALLERCRLLIGLDSGPQHLASAVGTPCISLFSFAELRGEWVPWGRSKWVIQNWVDCHTCLREECPFDNRCMELTSVELVVALARRVLNGEDSAPPFPAEPGTTGLVLRRANARYTDQRTRAQEGCAER
jgi:ADP-heptose:LPS heptosyltransferase